MNGDVNTKMDGCQLARADAATAVWEYAGGYRKKKRKPIFQRH